VARHATGGLASLANLDGGADGIFRGPDPVADEIIASGDELPGSAVFGSCRGSTRAGWWRQNW